MVTSACSNAPRIRRRSSGAWSIVFVPGVCSAKWSLPKWVCWAPVETMRLSYPVTVICPRCSDVTAGSVGSMVVRSPSRTAALAWSSGIIRVEGAISPSEAMAGGDLVGQGLERVVGGVVDHGDVDVREVEGFGREQPTEARSDDDDAMACGRGLWAARAFPVTPRGYDAVSGEMSGVHDQRFD